MKRPFGSNFKYSCRRPSKEAVWRGKRYSHSNCYRAILLTHPQLHSPQTSHSHTIIVQAGSFTGKVITLCLPRHVRTPRCAEGKKADSEENAVHLTVSSRLQLRPNFSLFSLFLIRKLTQLNKQQDNTNFNLLGGHVVEFRDVDMAVCRTVELSRSNL